MATRPQTIREMQAIKQKAKSQKASVTVLNISNQLIKIHLNPPVVNGKKLDFFVGAQDIALKPGQNFTFPRSRLRMEQLTRLQKMGKISIVKETSDE